MNTNRVAQRLLAPVNLISTLPLASMMSSAIVANPAPAAPPRNPWCYATLVAAVVGLGLASRHFAWALPVFAQKSAGDALWALMVFFLAGLLFRRRPTSWNAAAAMLFSALIEFSQIYHAPWIDAVRGRTLGHLMLGSGFAWPDLLAYAVGISVGVAGEAAATFTRSRLPATPAI